MKNQTEKNSNGNIPERTTPPTSDVRRKSAQNAPIKTPNGVLNKHNYADRNDLYEKPNTLPSMTVPDQTMSLKEMLARYVRGGEVNIKQAQFSDDPDFDDPDLSKMDQFEKRDMLDTLKQEIEEMRQDLASARENRQGGSPSIQQEKGSALNAENGEAREDRPVRDGAAAPTTQGDQSEKPKQH